MKALLRYIHPVLPVKNVTEAIGFYTQKLGFKLQFKDAGKDPKYAGVGRDSIEIHLQRHDPSEWDNNLDRPLLRIYVDEVDTLFEEFHSQNVFHAQTALRNTEWGTREFGFYDNYGNGLIFYRDLS